jgi:ATP-binding cassette subfamily C protein LapB
VPRAKETPQAAPQPLPAATGHWFWTPLLAARGLLLQVALAALLVNLLALATTLYSMTVYNRILPAGATASLTALTLGMLLVLAMEFALRSLRTYFTDVAARGIDLHVGHRLFASLTGLRMSDRQKSSGNLAALLREFETLREFFASATVTALADLPFLFVYLLVIFWLAPPLAIVPALAALAVAGLALAGQPLLDRLSAASLGQSLGKQSVLVETAAGLETVKSSLAGPMLTRRWMRSVAEHADLSLRQRLVSSLPVNLAATAQSLVYVLTLAVGVGLVTDESLTMGALIAASMLAGRCVAPLAQVAALTSRISQTRQSWKALDTLIARGRESDATEHALRRPRLSGAIRFRNVSFRYPGSDVRALDNISLDIAPGERVAIIGRTGSGKSTLTRLILGLYAPQDGAVMVDDADIRQLHPDDLRRNIGAVLQDVMLFSGTIAENIRLEDPDVDDAAILAASRLSGADQFIGQLPRGYDLKLSDRGEGLSGGQRQAIALARALARPRPILLLDEPTSALDMASETALIDRLEVHVASLDEPPTMVIVTHRPSLLRLATRVVLMEEGRIAMSGPPAEVLRALGHAS